MVAKMKPGLERARFMRIKRYLESAWAMLSRLHDEKVPRYLKCVMGTALSWALEVRT